MRVCPRTVATVCTALLGSTGMVGCAVTGDRTGGNKEVAPVVLTVLNTRSSVEIQPFVDQVKTLSGGRISLDVTSQWHASNAQADPEAIKAVEAGQSVLGFVPTRAFHDLGVTSLDALGAPLTIDSLALEQRVLGSDVATTMLTGVGALGLHGLGLMPGPMRKPVGLTRKLLGPGDYRGARIAISASAVTARALSALEATPVASPFNGASMAPYDGLEQQTESVANNQYDTPGNSITANVNLWARPIALFANAKVFQALPASTRALLQKAAVSAIPAATQVQTAAAAEGLDKICRRGNIQLLDATPAQVAQLRSAFAPVYAWLRGYPATATAIDRINAMRSGLENAVAAETPSCQTAGKISAGANSGTPLDGIFESDVTARELFSHGSPDAPAENIGHFVWAFDRGRVIQGQESKDGCTWGYGKYSVSGEQLTLDMINGGGITPNNAGTKPGEHGVMAWSLYHDMLTLTPTAPDSYWIKPMRRVQTTPTAALFSRRCPPPAAAFPIHTALDGTWTTTFSKVDLAGSPLLIDQEEINDQNWGSLTLTFANGLCKQSGTNKVTSGSRIGTYTVAGDILAIHQEDGEIFTMRWSIYQDTLILRRDKTLGVGPTPLVLKPWARASPGR